MPTVYRIEYSEGTTSKTVDAALAGQVTFDGKTHGKTMSGGFQALWTGNTITPLPHPLEASSLRAQNETYLSASLKGILLNVERRICLGCGHIFDSPKLSFSGATGCLTALLVALASFALSLFLFKNTVAEALLIAWLFLLGACFAGDLLGFVYVRWRFSKRQSQINQRDCPACGCKQSISVAKAAGKRVEIGKEGKWLKVSISGIS
jgi:hypothetical protein